MTCVVTALKVGIPLNVGICCSEIGRQEGAQPSRVSPHKIATKHSPAMVTYLKEQDAHKSFLVTGHPASRSSIGEAESERDRTLENGSDDKIDTTSEYLIRPAPARYSTKIDCGLENSKL